MKIAVLASGSGSNLQSIIDACNSNYIPNSKVILVISNNEEAFALQRAKDQKIESLFLKLPDGCLKFQKGVNIEDIMNDPVRQEYDQLIVSKLRERDIDVVCLAGYMLFITPRLINEFPNSIINIHPSILPSFRGLNGVADARSYGVKILGCTTHFVDEKEDNGPVILQAATPVFNENFESISEIIQRNLRREHLIYPETLRLYKEGLIKINGRIVEISWDEKHFEYQGRILELWRHEINDYYHSR